MTVRISRARFVPALAFALALGGAIALPVAAQADERDHCRNEIARDEHRLEWAVYSYGRLSYQADVARHRLDDAREDCWRVLHVWWDDRGARWREEHDWDDDYRHDRW